MAVKLSIVAVLKAALDSALTNSKRLLPLQRLKDSTDIQRVYQQGKKLNSPHGRLFFCANQSDYARLCISVGKKQVAKAVARNRIKRIIRESFRHHQTLLGKVDIFFVVFKSMATLDNSTMRQFVDKQWQRLAH